MTLLDGIVLGLVQGITEFLPISSSGHLVLAQALLGVDEPGILLEVATHAATLLAVAIYFRRRILDLALSLRALPHLSSASEKERTDLAWIGYLLLGSVPAGIAGLALKDAVEAAFESPALVLAMLCVTGAFLLATRFAPAPGRPVTAARALVVGFAQALALLPGVSRSGSTIGAGLFLRLDGEKAAAFSFLLSLPAVGGAALLEARHVGALTSILPTLAAAAVALASGYAAIAVLMRLLRRRSLWVFGPYCLTVGAAGILWLVLAS